ncbi:hypothetical protein [Kocuria rosea]|nr:hypothetical protein [Kocuria rosea]
MTSVTTAPRVDIEDRTCREKSPAGRLDEARRMPGIDSLEK